MARPRKHAEWWPFHWKSRRWRRTELPAEIRAAVALDVDENVLSYGSAVDGSPVVATDRGLWLTGGDGMRRLEWERIGTVAAGRRKLELTLLTENLAAPRPLTVDLADPGELVEAAWDQMADYTVTATHVPVTATAGMRIVGRRAPGAAEVVWGLVPDSGLDVGDPTVRTEAALALEKAKRDASGEAQG